MANEEQLSILKQGVQVWNKWREENYMGYVDFIGANLKGANFRGANLKNAYLNDANLSEADFTESFLSEAHLKNTDLSGAFLGLANLDKAFLGHANLSGANLVEANLSNVYLGQSTFWGVTVGYTNFGNSDLSGVIGLQDVFHIGPSIISTGTLANSKGKIPEEFLRGCGLIDWEIEEAKLYDTDLSSYEVNIILYRVYELRANQARQVSPLFISYSHADVEFVDKIDNNLTKKGIRFWRDIHDMKAGRMEKQVDRAIRQNPTILLVLSANSLSSDWVEHEVYTARELEKELGRDILCPVALDDSWKDSKWEKRIMEQVMKYNILDFSEWRDEIKFNEMFRKLIDGLQLFYKG